MPLGSLLRWTERPAFDKAKHLSIDRNWKILPVSAESAPQFQGEGAISFVNGLGLQRVNRAAGPTHCLHLCWENPSARLELNTLPVCSRFVNLSLRTGQKPALPL